MAFDKVVDSTRLDSALTATANAIRSKIGGGGIQWDLDTGFKSVVDTMPIYPVIEYGSITQAEDVSSAYFRIPHSLGIVPDFIIAKASKFDLNSSDVSYIVLSSALQYDIRSAQMTLGNQLFMMATRAGKANTTGMNYYDNLPTKFSNTETFVIPYYNSSQMLKSGVTYSYIIGKWGGVNQ